jgi:hypothetical protein
MKRMKSTARGIKVPQLGEQEKQSLPPLNVFSGKDSSEHLKNIARNLGMIVAQLIGEGDFPKAELAYIFSLGEPLVRPEQILCLPT